MCRVKSGMGGILKIMGLRLGGNEVSAPTIWGCPSPMGFTHCKQQGEIYHDLGSHWITRAYVGEEGLLHLLLKERERERERRRILHL